VDVQPFAGALEAVDRILNREPEADEVLRQTVAVLHERIEHYTWVGLYFVEEGELVLGPWAGSGAPERARLPLGEGLAARAATEQRTEVAGDVSAIAGYAASFPWTRSEIDVPVVFEGRTVGVIGIDSAQADAFGPDDRRFLERVALLVSVHCLVGWDTGGVPWSEVG
jgi:GAF domain-containing protein